MTHNNKVTGKATSMPVSLATGVCISLGMTLILSAVLAKLISIEKVEWKSVGYWIMAILMTASAIGTKATCLLVKRRKAVSCMIGGVLYWLGLLIIDMLFYGGQYTGIGVTGMMILCGCAAVCLLELRSEKGPRATSLDRKGRKKYYSHGK